MKKNKYLIQPDINNLDLTRSVKGIDERKQKITTKIIEKLALGNSVRDQRGYRYWKLDFLRCKSCNRTCNWQNRLETTQNSLEMFQCA